MLLEGPVYHFPPISLYMSHSPRPSPPVSWKKHKYNSELTLFFNTHLYCSYFLQYTWVDCDQCWGACCSNTGNDLCILGRTYVKLTLRGVRWCFLHKFNRLNLWSYTSEICYSGVCTEIFPTNLSLVRIRTGPTSRLIWDPPIRYCRHIRRR